MSGVTAAFFIRCHRAHSQDVILIALAVNTMYTNRARLSATLCHDLFVAYRCLLCVCGVCARVYLHRL